MTIQCPIIIDVTAPPPPAPTVTPCATYKTQRGIGANATQAQAMQANLDFYEGIIDQACVNAINASVVVATPARIVAIAAPSTYLPPATQEYVPNMTVSIGITWKNEGGTSGTYYPFIQVNGQSVYPPTGQQIHTLAGGASETVLFAFGIPAAGRFEICPGYN